jgi:hypothetical protein
MKSNTPSFERLEATVALIARHADYPGKHEVVAGCLEEIEGRWERGELTLPQRFRLYAILLVGTASPRPNRPLAGAL